jgi:sensor histidine kinase YesM
MLSPLSIRRAALLYLSVWLILGLVFAALVGGATGAAWTNALLFAVPVTLVYAVASGFSGFYLCRAFPLADKPPLAILAVFLVSALIAGGLWTASCALWNGMLNAVGNSAGMPMSNAMLGMIFGVGVLLYGLSAVANYLAIEFQRARNAERRELEAALMAREAELRLLRAQVDPHFLFNSLNSISALTSIDAARARTMTLALADFFRHSLGLQAGARSPLHAELTLALRFLSIEQVRFGARLRVEHEIDPEAGACLVPPMLLQPLVENAVKHGIAHLPEGGAVRLTARRAGSLLHVVVGNDIDPDLADSASPGIGLANVRQRLAADFAHEASMHCTRKDARFEVELMLPVLMENACAS